MFGVLEDDGTEKIVMAHQVILSLYSSNSKNKNDLFLDRLQYSLNKEVLFP